MEAIKAKLFSYLDEISRYQMIFFFEEANQ
jgi:hypothetical protein